jgi:hypothetical protein
MTLIKNLGRHSLPPLRRILSRDSKFQGQDREIEKWSSRMFWNYSEGATRWDYWAKSITTIGSRLAHRSSQGRQVVENFCTKFTRGCKQKYGEINCYRTFQTILFTRYLGCNLRWHCRATTVQCFSKLMWCTCLWRHDACAHVVWCLWCVLAWLEYPQNELVIKRTITGWEGVCVASRNSHNQDT